MAESPMPVEGPPPPITRQDITTALAGYLNPGDPPVTGDDVGAAVAMIETGYSWAAGILAAHDPDEPEVFGPFKIYQPSGGDELYQLGWAISYGGAWLPGRYADRDAAIFACGYVLGGESRGDLETIRNKAAGRLITVQDLAGVADRWAFAVIGSRTAGGGEVAHELDLEAIKARAEATPKAPWITDLVNDEVEVRPWEVVASWDLPFIEMDDSEQGIALARFIAHARQDVPNLLAEVKEQRAEIAQLRARLVTLNKAVSGVAAVRHQEGS